MTELRPLLESTDDELERALLRSVGAELPSGLGLRDTALALGLTHSTAETLAASFSAASSLSQASAPTASATATASTATVSTAAASTATASGGATGALGAATLGVVGKSLLGGAVASFLALTTLDYSLGSSSYRPQPALPVVSAAAAAPEASPVSSAAVTAPPLPDAEPVPTAAPAVAGGAYSRPSRLEAAAPAPPPVPARVNAPSNATFTLPPRPEQPLGPTLNASLAAEIRLLDQARTALAAGNSARAAALLDRYAANRPSPVLAQEAALLRVRLLLTQGDQASAAQLARRIMHDYPESAHVDSLRNVAAEP